MRINLPDPKGFSDIFKSSLGQNISSNINGISTDSRKIKKNDLYIAILGEKVDGHNFLAEAYDKGAISAIVDRKISNVKLNQIVVHNTIKTIGVLSKNWRKKFNIPIICITGSNGKTSTKELLKSILSSKFNTHSTKDNFNTSIGLPLTLLQLNDKHDISILELGANQKGDIKILCDIAIPTHGLITNISPAHLEGFGTILSVAKAKGALFQSLNNGIAFKNCDDKKIVNLKTYGKSITFGSSKKCDYSYKINYDSNDEIILQINSNTISTKLKNITIIKNLIACSAISRELGVEWKIINKSLLKFSQPKGRCEIKINGNNTIIDDTYNANPESTIAAIDYLESFSITSRKIFIFGDMLELGNSSKIEHERIGNKCNHSSLSAVLTVGKNSRFTDEVITDKIFHKHFQTKKDLISVLKTKINKNDTILIKGSRGMKMETIVKAIYK